MIPGPFSDPDPRARIRQAVVDRYRDRTTPAPAWVWLLCDAILKHTAALADAGEAILSRAVRWCDLGGADPELRTARRATRSSCKPASIAWSKLRELRELTPATVAGQDRVFVRGAEG